MISLLLKIYAEFEAQKQLFIDAGLKPISHIDKFRGQPLNPEQFEYYDLPALFVDTRTKWEKTGKAYDGVVSVDFHLVTDATWETSNISTSFEEGLRNEVYHALVRTVLDDLESEHTRKLRRVDENGIDTGVVNYQVLKYECMYNDPMLSGTEWVNVMIESLKLAGKLRTPGL